jgi:CheY-like chemotaxis protein
VVESRVSIIHGDLNLQNILVDQATGFAWLIDFAETRLGPTLFDLQRLESQIITKLFPAALKKSGLEPVVIAKLLESLHADSPRPTVPPLTGVRGETQAVLQEPYTILVALRRLARQYLMDDRDWDEYYLGLTITLIGTLKFANLTPLARQLALIGAMAVRGLMQTSLPNGLEKRVLVVEDDPVWQEILYDSLVEVGFSVEIADTFTKAQKKLRAERFSLVTIDSHLSHEVQTQEGILLLDFIRKRFGLNLPVVIVSAEIDKRDIVRAFRKFSVSNVILKQYFEYDEFYAAIRDALPARPGL